MHSPAIFLDRDGVINENREDYVKSWEEFIFLPGALTALRHLAFFPGPIIVVTNQSAIGRGIITADAVRDIHEKMCREIEAHGGRIDGIFFCPHHPDQQCDCRKPQPGLLLQAQQRFSIDLTNSYLIGDAAGDILAAQSVGCRAYLVQTGRGRQQSITLRQITSGYRVVPNLSAAVEDILDSFNTPPSITD
jgi:D-glycero-D-manno-heptose 1,7-bisphosphate phosphatase